MEMEEADGFQVLTYIPIPKLPYGNPGTTYTLVEMSSPSSGLCFRVVLLFVSVANSLLFLSVTGTFLNTLKFVVKDCDPNTGEPDDDQGFKDEYVVSTSFGIHYWNHI